MHFIRTLASLLPLLLLLALPRRALAVPTLFPRAIHANAVHDLHHPNRPHVPKPTSPPAVAPPPPPPMSANPALAGRNPVGNCNVAGQHCCSSTLSQSANSSGVLAGLIGASDLIPGSGLLVGLECTPLAPLLAAGGECTATTVCCSGTQTYNGLINFGCSPLAL